MSELDDALGLSDLASGALTNTPTGANRVHRMDGLFRQAVCCRPAEYEGVIDAKRLAHGPVMWQVDGHRPFYSQAASTSPMCRFETEGLSPEASRAALADLGGQWIDRSLEGRS